MIKGSFYDGQVSRRIAAGLHRRPDGEWEITADDGAALYLGRATISPRLANTPRYLALARNARFETDANDAIDHLLTEDERDAQGGWVHRLECHWYLALAALFGLLLSGWLAIHWGIPAAARIVAERLPAHLLDASARATLQQLEDSYLSPSELDPKRQQQLRQLLAPALNADGHQYRVLFYAGGDLGANAFALPDGTLIFTDELVALAENDNELLAVAGHEIGHVIHRHALRQVLQGTAVATLIFVMSGDTTVLSGVLMALPTQLLDLAYSRDFELEADAHAVAVLRQQGLDGTPMIAMLHHLEQDRKSGTPGLEQYLSSHPAGEARIATIAGAGSPDPSNADR